LSVQLRHGGIGDVILTEQQAIRLVGDITDIIKAGIQ
jgi:hypothetical protein